jgi:3-phenylpropionate/trans-cinnamate dioxygenase ferredoxin subunit
MTTFVAVGSLADLPPGERLFVDLEEESVAIFNVDGCLYCIADVCTHDGGPVADGELDGHAIVCPRHGAMFDIRNGAVLAMPAVVPIASFPVEVSDGVIYVGLPDD